ncbi:hypothetical protein ACNIWB_28455, partial [Escherichia coli]
SAQIREILISESAWEEMTCLFAPSLGKSHFYKHAQIYQISYCALCFPKGFYINTPTQHHL